MPDIVIRTLIVTLLSDSGHADKLLTIFLSKSVECIPIPGKEELVMIAKRTLLLCCQTNNANKNFYDKYVWPS
ncbi:hypothetical protein CBW57_19360 [Yersinia intermedia]|uniref:Uncharacterized protein n=1 Tax=Yersinia intermedia TaxID=631 RepID=A0A208ZRE3_YERIN|nr:hypothetical protein CBW57_19360 [Yersinia intermedia]